MMPPTSPRAGVAPLPGSSLTEADRWLGAAIAHLLTDHLAAAGLTVLDANTIAQRLVQARFGLPLSAENASALREMLRLRALVHGSYVLDTGSKTLGLTLWVAGANIPARPLEAAAPLSSFSRYIERVSLALIGRLGVAVTDEIREQVAAVPRPQAFEAFQQVAQARLAWSKGDNEIALAAVESALAFDAKYEKAIAIRIAIAREAGDTNTVQDAFRQWATAALKRKKPTLAAERYVLLGHWLIERQEWADARRAYREAADIFRREGDEVGELRARNNLAALDVTVGSPGAAIATLRRSLRVLEENPATRLDAAQAYFNLALAHKQQGQQEEAIRALEQAMQQARAANDQRLQARIVAQRGTIRDDMGQWAEAMADYARATNLLDALEDTLGRAMVRAHQALLYRHQGAYDRAEAILMEALTVFDNHPHPPPHDHAVLWLNLADLYFAMGSYEQAWEFASRAHETFEELDSTLAERAAALIEALPEEEEEIEEDPASEGLLPSDENAPEEETPSAEGPTPPTGPDDLPTGMDPPMRPPTKPRG